VINAFIFGKLEGRHDLGGLVIDEIRGVQTPPARTL
jgi:hypothetical protein